MTLSPLRQEVVKQKRKGRTLEYLFENGKAEFQLLFEVAAEGEVKDFTFKENLLDWRKEGLIVKVGRKGIKDSCFALSQAGEKALKIKKESEASIRIIDPAEYNNE